MTSETMPDWPAALQQYARDCRERQPVVPRTSLDAEGEWRCRQIGGSLYGWLQRELPVIHRQRHVVCQMAGFAANPIIVMTTEMAGLVAAHELLELPAPEIACLLPEEFETWTDAEADPDFQTHLHYWNNFRQPDDGERAEIEARGMLPGGVEGRLHVIGCLWGPRMGMKTTHLWGWDGRELALVQEAFAQVTF